MQGKEIFLTILFFMIWFAMGFVLRPIHNIISGCCVALVISAGVRTFLYEEVSDEEVSGK